MRIRYFAKFRSQLLTVFQYLLVFLALAPIANIHAHTLRPAVATLEVSQSGQLDLQIRANAEALMVGIGPEHTDTDDSPDAALYNELRALPADQLTEKFVDFAPEFVRQIEIRANDALIPLQFDSIVVPPTGDLELARDSMILLTGEIASGVEQIEWLWPERFGSSVLRLTTPLSDQPTTTWLQAGQVSDPLSIAGVVQPASIISVVFDYIVIGFEHILPLGLDHILFVLGLFLLSTRWGPLLWQVSAFTLAHTLTLGLSIYGLISLPASVVEPLIALSIAYVGIENCWSSALKPWRVALVFLFGLLHGLGFAGVLSEIGLPEGEFITALLSFNVGVELGQLAVIALAFSLVGWFRNEPWYRQRIVIPASLAIAAMGLYWTWERVFS